MSVSISIVTICFNNLEELKKTIASVDMQGQLPYEHWVVDGSTDGSIGEWLKTTPQPPYRKWISERDKGIADAFNKGVTRATGTVVNMLNSGDTYSHREVLRTVTNEFEEDADLMWLHGKYRLQRGGVWVVIGKPFDPEKLYRGMRSLSHQSMFVKKRLHDQYGLYDVALRNAMDYDFVCRIARERFVFIPEELVTFAPGGTTDVNYLKALAEGRMVYRRHFGASFKLWFWQTRLRGLHAVMKSPVGPLLYRLKVALGLANA